MHDSPTASRAVAEQPRDLLLDRAAVHREERLRCLSSISAASGVRGRVGARVRAHHDLQLASAQARGDLEPVEADLLSATRSVSAISDSGMPKRRSIVWR